MWEELIYWIDRAFGLIVLIVILIVSFCLGYSFVARERRIRNNNKSKFESDRDSDSDSDSDPRYQTDQVGVINTD